MQPTLFVSIAAYRDPELWPTLRDLFAKADHPEQLHVCVCDQYGPEGEVWPEDLAAHPGIQRMPIPWRESQGACWARAQLMDAFGDQDFYLQLDSHHRFVPGWDSLLHEEWRATGREKALLTGYVNPYVPGEPLDLSAPPLTLAFDAFHADGIAVIRSHYMAPDAVPGKPVNARFISGHFLFAPAAFVREVPYDRDLYFIGEEISLSVRAFLEGWYLYHPSRVICFHEYTRAYRDNKHWSDHEGPDVETPWWQRDLASRRAVAALLHDPERRGSVRTLQQYQDYAGIHFARQRVHPATLANVEPPTPVTPGWETEGSRWSLVVRIPESVLDGAQGEDCWQFDVLDDTSQPLYRRDLYRADLERAPLERDHRLWPVSFDADATPVRWSLLPFGDTPHLNSAHGTILVAPPAPPTVWVTALLDLGREHLSDPRPYSEYRDRLTELLCQALPDAQVVVYADPADHAWLQALPRTGTLELRAFTFADLTTTPHFATIESLRQRASWRNQTDWLGDSPQAALSGYAALVMHKIRLLAEVAASQPESARVFWVDAGLTRTVQSASIAGLAAPATGGTLQWFAYPYPEDTPEIHGFERTGLTALAGRSVTHVLRGGFFGGLASIVRAAQATYERWVARTLEAGLLGTEESLFSLLHAPGEPGWEAVTEIPADGLIPSEPYGRLPVDLVLPLVPDRITVARIAARVAALDRRSTPAHLRIRSAHAWAHAALVLPFAEPGDVATLVVDDTGAGAPTMAFVQPRDIDRALEDWVVHREDGQRIRMIKVGAARPAPPVVLEPVTAVYVLTYNAPDQLALWMAETAKTCPQLLSAEVRVVVNNSTDPSVRDAYDRLCAQYGFLQLRYANVGITGGRLAATRHFLAATAADQMWYFEDDMTVVAEPGTCRNGFTRQVPELFEVVRDIVATEPGLDSLKLCFSEYFGCHQLDWAWVNADADERRDGFVEGSATRLRTIRVTRGVPWVLGDVHYSHWPMVLTRRGAAQLAAVNSLNADETGMMLHVHALQREEKWQGAVLLASPIEHRRVQRYAADERRES